MTSLARFVNVSKQTRRAVTVAFASICLVAGCSHGGLIDDSSAAAAPTGCRDATAAGASTAPLVPAAPLVPVPPLRPALPALGELLADEKFVPAERRLTPIHAAILNS